MEHKYTLSEKIKAAILAPLAITFLLFIIFVFSIDQINFSSSYPYILNSSIVVSLITYVVVMLTISIGSLISYKFSEIVLTITFGRLYFTNGSRLEYILGKSQVKAVFISLFIWSIIILVMTGTLIPISVASGDGHLFNSVSNILSKLLIFNAILLCFVSFKDFFRSISLVRLLIILVLIISLLNVPKVDFSAKKDTTVVDFYVNAIVRSLMHIK